MRQVDEETKPPAAAYRIVEKIIPPSFFYTPSPPAGVILTVTGDDGIATYWHVSTGMAPVLHQHLAAHRSIRRVSAQPYRNDKR